MSAAEDRGLVRLIKSVIRRSGAADLAVALADYVTNAGLTSTLAGYAQTSDLDDYATSADLTSGLAGKQAAAANLDTLSGLASVANLSSLAGLASISNLSTLAGLGSISNLSTLAGLSGLSANVQSLLQGANYSAIRGLLSTYSQSEVDSGLLGRSKVFVQDDAPTATATNDVWIDSNDNFKVYRWNGSSWAAVQSTLLTGIIDSANVSGLLSYLNGSGGLDTIINGVISGSISLGDIKDALDLKQGLAANLTSLAGLGSVANLGTLAGLGSVANLSTIAGLSGISSNIQSLLQASSYADAVALLDSGDGLTDLVNGLIGELGGITSSVQDDAPSSPDEGDIWFDSNDNNKLYRYNGSTWVAVTAANLSTLAGLGSVANLSTLAGLGSVANLSTLAGLGSVANLSTLAGLSGLSANVQTLLQGADYAAIRSALSLVPGTNVQAYSSVLGTYAGINPSANIQSLLGAANFAAARTALGLEIGTNVQAYSSVLGTYAGINPSANIQSLLGSANYAAAVALLDGGGDLTDLVNGLIGEVGGASTYVQDSAPGSAEAGDLWFDSNDNYKLYRYDGDSWEVIQASNISTIAGLSGISSNVQTLLQAADYSAIRTALSLVPGTNVQAYSSVLGTYAAINPSANIQSLLGSADYAAARTALGLAIGTNVQAYSSVLGTYAGINPSANVQAILGGANYAAIRGLLDLEAGTDFYSVSAADSLLAAKQAASSVLTTYAGITPSANVQSLLGAANYAAARALLDLEPGTDFPSLSTYTSGLAGKQAASAALDTYAGITPSANVQSLLGGASFAAIRGLLDLEAGTDFYSVSGAEGRFSDIVRYLNRSIMFIDNTFSESSAGTLVAPSNIAAGELLVFLNIAASTTSSPTAVTPTGFTNAINGTNSFLTNTRYMASWKIADGTEGGATITGMNPGTGSPFERMALLRFRVFESFTSVTFTDAYFNVTAGSIGDQSNTVGSATEPAVGLSMFVAGTSGPITRHATSRSYDFEIGSGSRLMILRGFIFSENPTNYTAALGDDGPDYNMLWNLWFELDP